MRKTAAISSVYQPPQKKGLGPPPPYQKQTRAFCRKFFHVNVYYLAYMTVFMTYDT